MTPSAMQHCLICNRRMHHYRQHYVGGISTANRQSELTVRNASLYDYGQRLLALRSQGRPRLPVEVLATSATTRSPAFKSPAGTVDAGGHPGSGFSGLGTGSGRAGPATAATTSRDVFDDAQPWAIENLTFNTVANSTRPGTTTSARPPQRTPPISPSTTKDAAVCDHLCLPVRWSGHPDQPTNQSACVGSNATFTVVANGLVSYQWYFGLAQRVGLFRRLYSISPRSRSATPATTTLMSSTTAAI